MNKLMVGQKVYLKPVNNRSRYIEDSIINHIKEYEIKKVGRKYFEVWEKDKGYSTEKFHIEDLRQHTVYSPDWELYLSRQDILDEMENLEIVGRIRTAIGNYGFSDLPLEKLRKIIEIIEEES